MTHPKRGDPRKLDTRHFRTRYILINNSKVRWHHAPYVIAARAMRLVREMKITGAHPCVGAMLNWKSNTCAMFPNTSPSSAEVLLTFSELDFKSFYFVAVYDWRLLSKVSSNFKLKWSKTKYSTASTVFRIQEFSKRAWKAKLETMKNTETYSKEYRARLWWKLKQHHWNFLKLILLARDRTHGHAGGE